MHSPAGRARCDGWLATVTEEVTTTRATIGLRRLVALMLWLLTAEFLLGMSVNLFVEIPAAHPSSGAASYFSGLSSSVGWVLAHGALLLRLHVALGLLLTAGSILVALLALAQHRRGVFAAVLVGWIGITGAAFNGASFINYGHDFSSMLMATCFAIAAASYVIALVSLVRAVHTDCFRSEAPRRGRSRPSRAHRDPEPVIQALALDHPGEHMEQERGQQFHER